MDELDEVSHRSQKHIAFPSKADFNDMTACECMTTTVDLFFDALTKIKEQNSVEVINYTIQKISQHLIQQHLNETKPTADAEPRAESSLQIKPTTSSRILWINLLTGFSSCLQPSDLSAHTLNMLTLVDILENVQRCLLAKHNQKTFRLLIQLFISVSEFPELQDDESQQVILELQQEVNTQELIYQHRSSHRSSNLDRLCEVHPIAGLCTRIKNFVSSIVTKKLAAKLSNAEGDSNHKPLIPNESSSEFPETNEGCVEESMKDQLMEQIPEANGPEVVCVETSELPPEHDPELQDSTVESSVDFESETGTISEHAVYSFPHFGPKQPYKKWSQAEEEKLIKCVGQFGEGNWEKILAEYTFSGRNEKALNQKWTKMKKATCEGILVTSKRSRKSKESAKLRISSK